MRIVITGAAGTLGGVLIPRLMAAGHVAVAVDLRRGHHDAEWHVADIRDAEAVTDVTAGADLIVHGAALHGIHLGDHTRQEFYDLNLTATFNVWQAAVAHRVRGVVFSSTMGVYGETRRPVTDDEVVFLDEAMPLLPGDIYGWTKVAGEELARYHLREHGIPSVAMRFGMFVPEPFFRYGVRLLYGGVHEDDVADAVMAAIGGLDAGKIQHEVFNVEAPLPFTPEEDAADLRRAPLTAIDRHWPGAAELLRSRGVQSLKPVTEVFSVRRLGERLGFRPRHDFGAWLGELADRPEEQAERHPPWP
ncbi:MAG: NAD(P)-dependent oxidoreductase [Chloroflexota bacterium]|nr:NAD(P)-dependent oxidoreductase [Chloroflexota bacterium]